MTVELEHLAKLAALKSLLVMTVELMRGPAILRDDDKQVLGLDGRKRAFETQNLVY